MALSEEAIDEYKTSLADLNVNSKPLINMLTMLAEDHEQHASKVVEVIEEHIHKCKPPKKLPVLYLMDSIMKNLGQTNYKTLFAKNIVQTFTSVFEQVDEKTRASMFKLRQTWSSVLPNQKLYMIDVRINSLMDPAWPITATPPEKTSIHVNPKFLAKSGSSGSGSERSSPEMIQEEEMEDEEETVDQEAVMRQQLIAKQQELLELQQARVKLELAEAKEKLKSHRKQTTKPHTTSSKASILPLPPMLEDPIPDIDIRTIGRDTQQRQVDPRPRDPRLQMMQSGSLNEEVKPSTSIPFGSSRGQQFPAQAFQSTGVAGYPESSFTGSNPIGGMSYHHGQTGMAPLMHGRYGEFKGVVFPDDPKFSDSNDSDSSRSSFQDNRNTAMQPKVNVKDPRLRKQLQEKAKENQSVKSESSKVKTNEGNRDPRRHSANSSVSKSSLNTHQKDATLSREGIRGSKDVSHSSKEYDNAKSGSKSPGKSVSDSHNNSKGHPSSKDGDRKSVHSPRDSFDLDKRKHDENRNRDSEKDNKVRKKEFETQQRRSRSIEKSPEKSPKQTLSKTSHLKGSGDNSRTEKGIRRNSDESRNKPKTNDSSRNADKHSGSKTSKSESNHSKISAKDEPGNSSEVFGSRSTKREKRSEERDEDERVSKKAKLSKESATESATDKGVNMEVDEKPQVSNDLSELFGSEDIDYRPVALDHKGLPLQSPSSKGWDKFKASQPDQFAYDIELKNQRRDVDQRRTRQLSDASENQDMDFRVLGDEILSPPLNRRDIPKELSLSQHAEIIIQAQKQLRDGRITAKQHQDLMQQVQMLMQVQQQLSEESVKTGGATESNEADKRELHSTNTSALKGKTDIVSPRQGETDRQRQEAKQDEGVVPDRDTRSPERPLERFRIPKKTHDVGSPRKQKRGLHELYPERIGQEAWESGPPVLPREFEDMPPRHEDRSQGNPSDWVAPPNLEENRRPRDRRQGGPNFGRDRRDILQEGMQGSFMDEGDMPFRGRGNHIDIEFEGRRDRRRHGSNENWNAINKRDGPEQFDRGDRARIEERREPWNLEGRGRDLRKDDGYPGRHPDNRGHPGDSDWRHGPREQRSKGPRDERDLRDRGSSQEDDWYGPRDGGMRDGEMPPFERGRSGFGRGQDNFGQRIDGPEGPINRRNEGPPINRRPGNHGPEFVSRGLPEHGHYFDFDNSGPIRQGQERSNDSDFDRQGPMRPGFDRPGPPFDRQGPPVNRPDHPMDIPDHELDRRGPPFERLGSPDKGHGPPFGRPGSLMDMSGPQHDRPLSPGDRPGPPMNRIMDKPGLPFDGPLDRPGPPFDRSGPPFDRPLDRSGPPFDRPHDRPGPPFDGPLDRPGPPFDRSLDRPGPPFDGPLDRPGPPFDRPGPPFDGPHDRPGPPFDGPHDRPGPPFDGPFDRPGPPFGRQGPPMDRPRSLLDRPDPLLDRPGPLLDRPGPTFDRPGPPFDVHGPPSESLGSPTNRTSGPFGRPDPMIERPGSPLSRHGPDFDRPGPQMALVHPLERHGPDFDRPGQQFDRSHGPGFDRHRPDFDRSGPSDINFGRSDHERSEFEKSEHLFDRSSPPFDNRGRFGPGSDRRDLQENKFNRPPRQEGNRPAPRRAEFDMESNSSGPLEDVFYRRHERGAPANDQRGKEPEDGPIRKPEEKRFPERGPEKRRRRTSPKEEADKPEKPKSKSRRGRRRSRDSEKQVDDSAANKSQSDPDVNSKKDEIKDKMEASSEQEKAETGPKDASQSKDKGKPAFDPNKGLPPWQPVNSNKPSEKRSKNNEEKSDKRNESKTKPDFNKRRDDKQRFEGKNKRRDDKSRPDLIGNLHDEKSARRRSPPLLPKHRIKEMEEQCKHPDKIPSLLDPNFSLRPIDRGPLAGSKFNPSASDVVGPFPRGPKGAPKGDPLRGPGPHQQLVESYVDKYGDARFRSSTDMGPEVSEEVVFGKRNYEIKLGAPPRKIQWGNGFIEVYADPSKRGIVIDNELMYRFGERVKDVTIRGKRQKMFYHGKPLDIWIDGNHYEVRVDSPPKTLIINNQAHRIQVDGRDMMILIDKAEKGPYGGEPRFIFIDDNRMELRFDPPPRHIVIDGEMCELKLNVRMPCVSIKGVLHGIQFQGPPRDIFIDGHCYQIFTDHAIKLRVGNRYHYVALGGPCHELIIDGKWYEVKFDEPPKEINVGNRVLMVQIPGSPPEVKILDKISMEHHNMPPMFNTGPMPGPPPQPFPGAPMMPPGMRPMMMGQQMTGPNPMGQPMPGPNQPMPVPNQMGQPMSGPSQIPQSMAGPNPIGQPMPGPNPLGIPGFRPPISAPTSAIPGLGNLLQGMPASQPSSMPLPGMGQSQGMPSLLSSLFPRPAAPTSVAPTPAGGLDISSLLDKLVTSGIIKKEAEAKAAADKAGESGSKPEPDQPQSEPVPDSTDKKQMQTETFEEIPDKTTFALADLKEFHHGSIQRLYAGVQCNSCGTRFILDNDVKAEKYREHLDWHFRQNKLKKDDTKVSRCRKWYYAVGEFSLVKKKYKDWIQYEEMADVEDQSKSTFFEQQQQSNVQPSTPTQAPQIAMLSVPEGVSVIKCPAATGNDQDDLCDICHEPFEQYWDEDLEEWHMRDAIRVNNKTYHPICYEDHTDVSEGTPSPSVLVSAKPDFVSRKTLTYEDSSLDGLPHSSFEEERNVPNSISSAGTDSGVKSEPLSEELNEKVKEEKPVEVKKEAMVKESSSLGQEETDIKQELKPERESSAGEASSTLYSVTIKKEEDEAEEEGLFMKPYSKSAIPGLDVSFETEEESMDTSDKVVESVSSSTDINVKEEPMETDSTVETVPIVPDKTVEVKIEPEMDQGESDPTTSVEDSQPMERPSKDEVDNSVTDSSVDSHKPESGDKPPCLEQDSPSTSHLEPTKTPPKSPVTGEEAHITEHEKLPISPLENGDHQSASHIPTVPIQSGSETYVLTAPVLPVTLSTLNRVKVSNPSDVIEISQEVLEINSNASTPTYDELPSPPSPGS